MNSILVLFFSLLLSTEAIYCCGLPAHPNVAIVMEGKSDYDGPGASSFLVKEDESITWKAYWDPSGTSAAALLGLGGLSPAANFQGRDLYEIDDYTELVKTGKSKLKVKEITSLRDGTAISDAGGTISGSNFNRIGGNYGSSNIHAGHATPKAYSTSQAPIPGTTYTWKEVGGAWAGGMGTWEMTDAGFQVKWTLNENQTMSLADQPTAFTGNTLPYVYKTPSEDGKIGVGLSCESSIDLKYESGGARYTWSEDKVNGSGGVVSTRGPFSVEWGGTLNRAGGGDLQQCSVAVEDVSGPIGYAITPDSISGETGIAPGGGFEIKIADNYPYGSGSVEGELVYSTVVNDWEQEPGEKELCGDQYHPHHSACNCMAKHKERWVWKSVSLSGGSQTIVNGTDGFPAYAIYTISGGSDIEPLPWHYADLSNSYEDYLNFESCRPKVLVAARDHHGFGPAAPYSDGDENAQASEAIALGTVVPVVSANPDDALPNPDKGTVFSAMGRDGTDFGLWAGIDQITDTGMPDIRVFVKDTKYDWTILYGHQDSLDGTVAGYKSGRESGSGSSDTNEDSPYPGEAPASWVFSEEMDYADQLDMIRNGGFAPMQFIANGTGAYGFWADEDSRLVFKIVTRDNINQWDEGQAPTYTVSLSDGPAGTTADDSELDMNDGEFEYIFRDPNRGDGIDPDECTLTVTATDASGNTRTMTIHFFIACNELTLKTLEEERHQVDSWF